MVIEIFRYSVSSWIAFISLYFSMSLTMFPWFFNYGFKMCRHEIIHYVLIFRISVAYEIILYFSFLMSYLFFTYLSKDLRIYFFQEARLVYIFIPFSSLYLLVFPSSTLVNIQSNFVFHFSYYFFTFGWIVIFKKHGKGYTAHNHVVMKFAAGSFLERLVEFYPKGCAHEYH